MEVFQTPGRPLQLLPRSSEVSGGDSEATYQLQSVGVILFNVLHDSTMHHPLRHSDELSFPRIFLGPNKFQDVRMG